MYSWLLGVTATFGKENLPETGASEVEILHLIRLPVLEKPIEPADFWANAVP
jgi:hypothetical protein